MPTLHARIVDAMRKEGREVREAMPRTSPWPATMARSTPGPVKALHPNPRLDPGPTVDDQKLVKPPPTEKVWCPKCRMWYAADSAHAGLDYTIHYGPRHPEAPQPPVVRLVDSDYVIPDELSVDRPEATAGRLCGYYSTRQIRGISAYYTCVLPLDHEAEHQFSDDPTWRWSRRQP